MDVDDGRTATVVGIPSLPPTGTFTVPVHMTTTTIVPQKRKQKQVTEDSSTTEGIDCICGFSYEDGGLSIACDDCGRWCHTTCFNIIEGAVPEEWRCWECNPRPVDKERAVFLQQQRQRQNYEMMRKLSPGVEKKPRRASAPAIEGSGGRRKRSILTQQPNHHPLPTRIEEEQIDICEPPNTSYVHISRDAVPHREARQRLERAARGWRGVTALDLPEVEPHPPKTVLQSLPPSFISQSPYSTCTNPHVRPPAFSLHTVQPVPRSAMIAPYPSTILPSSTYLSDPLNAYAHLGMPKPFVHLIGPPLDLALDSRITGSEARFARSGCRPNAVLRPMICNRPKGKNKDPSSEDDPGISFGVFALRDMKANEEVVLGWEWDDGHAIHHLPTLIESPGLYSSHHLEHLRNQMTCMLHTLSSTFTTCACGSKSRDCVLRLMEAFVDYELPPKPPDTHVDFGPLVGRRRGFRTREKVPFSSGLTGVEMVALEPMSRAASSSSTDSEPHGRFLDANITPQTAVSSTSKPSLLPSASRKRRHDGPIRGGKGSSSDSDFDHSATPRQRQKRRICSKMSNPDLAQTSNKRTMPPKMRKQWIHQTMQEATPRLTRSDEASGTEEELMDIGQASAIMPPPPVPPRRKSKKTKKTSASPSPAAVSSPSMHFAKLSLLSPTVEIAKPSLDITTSSFDDRPQSPTPSNSSSPTPAGPPIKLHTKPISPLLAFTNLPPQPTVTNPPVAHKLKVGFLIDESPASPNILSLLPSIRRGRSEESVPTVTQELPASSSTNMEPVHIPADGNQPTPVPPSAPSPEVPLTDDSQPIAHSSPPREPCQSPSDQYEPTNASDPVSSPSTSQSVLQVSPRGTPLAEPPIEVKQEPEHPPTPSAREVSPAPQKVKTSFKDFLMRKKKEQVESPVISSSTIPLPEPILTTPPVPTRGSYPVTHPLEETKEPIGVTNQRRIAYLERSPELPTAKFADVDVITSTLIQPEPARTGWETAQYPDSPCELWPLDLGILKAGGMVADIRRGGYAGIRGVFDSVTKVPGRAPTASFKPTDGKTQPMVVLLRTTEPVRPSEEGETVFVLCGQHRGKVGKVMGFGKDMVSVEFGDPETVVDLEPRCLCVFFRESTVPLSDPTPPPPRVPPEKGDSISPPPVLQSEDGEIIQDPSTRSRLQQSGNSSFSQVTTPLRAAPINAPTQPRSFQNGWKNNTSTIPSRPNSLSHLMNANSNGGVNNPSNPNNAFANPPNRPSPPSGPKALRGLNPRTPFDGSRFRPEAMGSGLNGSGHSGMNGNGMGAGLKREPNPNNDHPTIPKGPSADRERDRERANGGWSTKNWGSGWR